MNALRVAALRYANHGWPVFPCRPRAKIPQTAKGLKDATLDAGLIDGWWTSWPDANVAVITGRGSGLVVLDVDGDDGTESLRALERLHEPLPATCSIVTPRGGAHYYFAHPGAEVRNSAGKLGVGLDIRGDGGYVLVPPSTVGDRSYQADERRAPTTMPDWLMQAIVEPSAPAHKVSSNEWLSIVREGVRGPDVWTGAPGEGRNDKLTRLVGHLLRRYVDVGLALELAHLVNEHRFRPPLSSGEVDRIVDSIAGKELRRRQRQNGNTRSSSLVGSRSRS